MKFWSKALIIALLLLVLIPVTWVNDRFSRNSPGGNDFLIHWVGTRAFLTEGLSPYSDEVALRIQTMVYGRAALPGENEVRVPYPVYSTLLFAPFALVKDFSQARALWMSLLEASLAALALLSLYLLNWKPGAGLFAAFLFFSLTWYHGVRPLINGNAVIIIALLFVAALTAIKMESDVLAGLLLAFTTIKPQLSILFILFVCLWAISRKRWRLIISMGSTVAILTFVFMLFIPDWISQNWREVLRYPGFNPPGTPGAAFASWFPETGHPIGWALTLILSILLLVEWYRALKQDYSWFLWTACLTLVISQWIGIQTDPGNFIILFFPLALVFSIWSHQDGAAGRLSVWMSILMLGIGLWVLFIKTVGTGHQPQQDPIMFFPLPLFLLASLYWVRDRAIYQNGKSQMSRLAKGIES